MCNEDNKPIYYKYNLLINVHGLYIPGNVYHYPAEANK